MVVEEAEEEQGVRDNLANIKPLLHLVRCLLITLRLDDKAVVVVTQ